MLGSIVLYGRFIGAILGLLIFWVVLHFGQVLKKKLRERKDDRECFARHLEICAICRYHQGDEEIPMPEVKSPKPDILR